MRVKSLAVAAIVTLSSAALVCPSDAAQRQRWPGGESRSGSSGGGNGGGGNGGGGQRQAGGGGQRQATGGGQRQTGGGGQRQAGSGGQRQAGERRSEPRTGGGRRETADRTDSQPTPQARQATRERQQPDSRQQPESRRQPESRQQPDAQTAPYQAGQSADIRRGTSDRWSNSRAGSGGGAQPRIAVPRQGPPPRTDRDSNWNRGSDRDWHRHGYRSYAPRSRNYYNYYSYYPRPYYYYPYAFGYGPRGRGFVYFDLHYNSHIFYPRTVIRYDNYGGYGTYGYPTGELRLQVSPRDAQVFVDGSYAGTVDDFDGMFQSLRLEEGEYQVELVLPGYEPLGFDVRIIPGEKITYRGDLIPEP